VLVQTKRVGALKARLFPFSFFLWANDGAVAPRTQQANLPAYLHTNSFKCWTSSRKAM